MFHNKVSIVLAAAALAALTASANAQTKPRHRHRQQVAERYLTNVRRSPSTGAVSSIPDRPFRSAACRTT